MLSTPQIAQRLIQLRADQAEEAAVREVLRLLVLSLGQRHRQALALVVDQGEITSRALADELDIGVKQASSLLRDLADYGLVSRHLARDRPGCRGFVWYPLAEIGGLR